jgi:hypothetical protein
MSKLGELVKLFNERYGAELGDADALKVVSDVRDTNPQLADQGTANSREDFVAERDDLLIDAALSVGTDRERQAKLLKALLDDEDFRDRRLAHLRLDLRHLRWRLRGGRPRTHKRVTCKIWRLVTRFLPALLSCSRSSRSRREHQAGVTTTRRRTQLCDD